METTVRSALRVILRNRKLSLTKRAAVIEQFRKSAGENDEKRLQEKKQIVFDYAELLSAVDEKERHILLDAGAERQLDGKELVRRSARRVGINAAEDV